MQGNGAKIGFVVLVVLIFGGAVYWFYGPNSAEAKQDKMMSEKLSTYVKSEGEIISTESNGRIGKGQDVIYIVQYKIAETGELKTAKVYGRDQDWDEIKKEVGSKFPIYYDPKSSGDIASETEYLDSQKK